MRGNQDLMKGILSCNSVHIQPSLRSELGHDELQGCDKGFTVMSHSNQSKDFEKALHHLNSFVAVILLLMDSDKLPLLPQSWCL